MPGFNLGGFTGGSEKEIANELAKMQKNLNWLLRHLDHLNVKQLYTEYCEIKSEQGETQINGPLLEMFDRQPVKRLEMGYSEVTGDFLYQMYNAAGDSTLYLDSNGNATLTGIVKTGPDGTAHLELNAGGFRGVTYDGLLSGLVFNPTSNDIVDLFLYHRGTKLLEFYDEIDGFVIRGASGALKMGIGGNTVPVFLRGDIDFLYANVLNLSTDSESDHNHGIPDGTELATADGGSVTFAASGGHSHIVG